MSGLEPFLVATSAATAAVNPIMALASSAIGTVQSIASRNASASHASAQANYLRAQADNERHMAAIREITLRRNQSRDQARSRALLAGRGVDIGSGSALLAREQVAANAEFDALLQRSAGAAQIADADFRARIAASDAASNRRLAGLDNSVTLLNFGSRWTRPGSFPFRF